MARGRRAEIELVADDRKFAQKLKDVRKKWAAFGKGLTQGAGNVGKGIHRTFARLGGSTLGKLTQVAGFAGGAALVGSEVQSTIRFEEALTRLKIQAGDAMGSLAAFRQQVMNVSNATGLNREEVLAAQTKYVTLTGDVKTAGAAMALFAKIAKGSGASMDDIASSAAALKQNMGIDPSQFERAFSILVREGKAGSVELRDMSRLLAMLAPEFAEFAGGKGIEGMADLGAALQVVNKGFNDADMAATALSGLMTAVSKNAGRLRAAGVEAFTVDAQGVKHLKSIGEIVDAIANSKLAKDQTLLQKALGRHEAYRAYLQLRNNREEWRKLGQENLNAKDVAEDYAKFNESASGRMQRAWTELKNTIAAAFTPERIQAFVQFLGFAIEKAMQLVDTLSNIPGYVEFLEGEGAVARGDEHDAFTDYVRRVTGKKKISPEDMARVSADLADENKPLVGFDISSGAMSQDDRQEAEKIIAGSKAYRESRKAARRADNTAGRGAYLDVGTGTKLDPTFYDLPEKGTWKARWNAGPGSDPQWGTGAKIRIDIRTAPGLDAEIADDPKQLVRSP